MEADAVYKDCKPNHKWKTLFFVGGVECKQKSFSGWIDKWCQSQ